MIPLLHMSTLNILPDDEEWMSDDVILYSVLYSSVTVAFAMAVLSKFLTNEFRFGFRSILSLVVLFLGEPLCQFLVKGPGGVAAFTVGCLLVYSILPASHLPVGNKAVLITGCDSGFGHELVKKLDGIGMKVFAGCLVFDGPGAISLRNNCSERLCIVKLDVTLAKDIENVTELIRNETGEEGLWGVVNNAGIWYYAELEMMSEDLLRNVLEVNFFGAVRMTKSLLPMIRQAKGRVVNVTSMLGRCSFAGNGAYAMSKHAMVAFSDTLRLEMKKWDVKVSIIEPVGYKTGSMSENILIAKKEKVWNGMTESVRELYGKEYLDIVYSTLGGRFDKFPDDLTPVIRAMRSGLLSKRPRERYPCGVGAETFMTLYGLIPVWLVDNISYLLDIVPKEIVPNALKK